MTFWSNNDSMVTPKFGASTLSVHAVLRKRVNEYFQQQKISSAGNYKLYIKASILLAGYSLVYIHLIFFTPLLWVAIIECTLLGILTASIGFNIMHDGAHGSFSKYPWLNKLAASSLDFLGASSFMWNMKHNVIHHAYTNIDGVDDDINAKPFLRLCETQKHYKIHQYQYIYFWLLYCLLYLFWVFFADYEKYFSHKIGNVPLKKLELEDHITFWSFKTLYAFLFIGLPVYFCGFFAWLTGFLILTAVAGFLLSIVFQLAHTVDETAFPVPIQPSNKIKDEWALHQLKSTANFATKNKFISWWLGGLNFQVEHHLFPKISHVHYPAICKIVRQTCIESGVPYIEYPTMYRAIKSHISYLKKLSRR
jgi:linoleoyl-CoA desaturase